MENIFDEFMEFHGDRYFRDDPAIVGGVAYLDGQPVTVIGIQKGKDFKDCMKHNYGMPSPEGDTSDETGRKIRTRGDHICKHSGSILRNGGRGAWAGGSDRPESL